MNKPRCSTFFLTTAHLPPFFRAQQDKKPRAQPGDFERQVDQIRKDIDSVRSNLADAEKFVHSLLLVLSRLFEVFAEFLTFALLLLVVACRFGCFVL